MADTLIWYGHGTQGLDLDGTHVLVDPFFTGNPAASTTADKVAADFILVSHGHGDHVADLISVAKRTGALVITNAEIAGWASNQGVKAHGQHVGGGFNHPFGYVKLTEAMHGSALPDGSNGGNPAGFLVTTHAKHKIYLACDTGLFGDMKLIGDEGVDLATLPIGDNYTMGPADALRAIKLIRPKHVVPVHYNTFDLLKQDAVAWAKQVEDETETKVHLLKPGESFTL